MRASQVRESVLSDHRKLREMLDGLEQACRASSSDASSQAGSLRTDAKVFLATLSSHMSWEDRYLAPVLREADAWGEERCAQLADDHEEQRNLLEYALRQLHDETRPQPVVAANLLDLIELLRDDMQQEEHALLGEDLLRDDVVAIDVTLG